MKSVDRNRVSLLVYLCVTSLATSRCPAQDNKHEQIDLGKAATAYVEISPESTATAFCIEPSGFFVTNAHVVEGTNPGQSIKLVLNPATNDQREITAVSVRVDDQLDLAVLKATEKDLKLPFLKLGDDAELYETGGITAFGYPFGKKVAQQTAYPGISINMGRVTALQKKGGKLERIQMDAQVNPGNSGGPVLDEKGAVVGVVSSGIFLTGVNYAIPVRKLKAFLNAPELTFAPERYNGATRYLETVIPAKVHSLLAPLKDPRVELELTQEGKSKRTITAVKTATPDLYEFRLKPIEPPDPGTPVWINGEASLRSSKISGRILDKKFRIAEKELHLSDAAEVRFGSEGGVKLHEGGELVGEITGLEKIDLELDEQPLQLDMAKLVSLKLQKLAVTEPEVNYALLVKEGDQVIGRLTGKLDIEGSIAPPKPAIDKNPAWGDWVEFTGEKRKIPLPAKIHDVIVAGGGRFLILHLKSITAAAIYDVNLGRVSKLIRLPAPSAVIAGAEQYFVIAVPEEKRLERWSLRTLRKDLGAPFPRNGKFLAMGMGSASNGPLLMLTDTGPGRFDTQFVSPIDLLESKVIGPELRGVNETARIRASAQGNMFTLWSANGSGSFEAMTLAGKEYELKTQHRGIRFASPNFDGGLILSGGAGAWPSDSESSWRDNDLSAAFLPTTCPSLVVQVPFELEDAQHYAAQPLPPKKATVLAANDATVLGDLPPLELGAPPENRSGNLDALSFDKRVIYIPQASQLVTIPFSGNQISVERVDSKAVLLQNKPERSICISSAPRTANLGAPYVHQIKVITNSPKLEYKLESGPMGMSVSPGGKITWSVPSSFDQKSTRAIVSIKDENGGMIYDTFVIDIL